MARRRTSRRIYTRRRRSSRRGFIGGGKLMRGLFPVGGVIAGALVGAGIATLQEKFLPQVIPYQSPIAGFAVAGIPGAAGALARTMLSIGTISGQGVSGYTY